MAPEVNTRKIYYKGNGQQATGVLARPDLPEPHPGVVVIQEWWGINENIKDIAQRFAREGYDALAPDLYHGQVANEPSDAQKLVMQLDRSRAIKEVTNAVEHLQGLPNASGKIGVIGYCMGGGLSLLAACRSPQVDASVVYYGGLPSPLEELEKVRCPVLAFYGSDEESRAKELEAEMKRRRKNGEVHVYPGAQHSFFNDRGTVYHRQAAEDSWKRVLEFFKTNLVR